MNFISINKNCLIGSCRAGKFTMTATNADIIVYLRDYQIAFIWNHINSFCRTTFRACSTGCFFSFNNTVILNKDCLPELGKLFCFEYQWF